MNDLLIRLLRGQAFAEQNFALQFRGDTSRNDLGQMKFLVAEVTDRVGEEPNCSERIRGTVDRQADRGGKRLRRLSVRHDADVFQHDDVSQQCLEFRKGTRQGSRRLQKAVLGQAPARAQFQLRGRIVQQVQAGGTTTGRLGAVSQHDFEARGKVLLKLNVEADRRDAVLAELPAAKSPTINQLANGDYAIETVVTKSGINVLIPALREAGATDLLEIPIIKIVH